MSSKRQAETEETWRVVREQWKDLWKNSYDIEKESTQRIIIHSLALIVMGVLTVAHLDLWFLFLFVWVFIGMMEILVIVDAVNDYAIYRGSHNNHVYSSKWEYVFAQLLPIVHFHYRLQNADRRRSG